MWLHKSGFAAVASRPRAELGRAGDNTPMRLRRYHQKPVIQEIMDLDAELDDLVFEISGGGANPFASQSSGGGSVESEVDDLLAELDLPAEKVTTVDDFDALMSDFETQGVSARAVSSSKKPQIKRKGKYTVTGAMADQELFTTLDELETKIKSTNLTGNAKGASTFFHKVAQIFVRKDRLL